MTPQALDRLAPAHRYQILAATAVEELTARVDEVLDLFDIALATIERAARLDDERAVAAGAETAAETVRTFSPVASVVLDDNVPDAHVRATILERIGRRRFEEVTSRAAELALDGDSYLDRLCARYGRLRQFAPAVLEAFEFHAADPNDQLLAGVGLLRELNRSRARHVPDGAPTGFASSRWQRHLLDAERRVDRHAWETCLLIELRGALRGANVWVDHSHRYRNPADYLIPPERWERLRTEFSDATRVPLEPGARLEQLGDEMNTHLAALDTVIGHADTVRVEDGRLVVPGLAAEESDPAAERFREQISSLLPEVDLVEVLVEVDAWCGFLDQLVHADHAIVFGLFDLTGLRFSPRIRDLADQRLWRLPSANLTGHAAQLLRHNIRPDRFTSRWDDMLRVAATIRYGYLPASTLVARLQASARQNQLTQAIQEYGRIIKTISILRYLGEHRRRINDQLNKGESLHALRRQLFYANQGQIRRRDSDDQDLQGECLTLLTNAIVCWNTVYMQAALDHLTTTSQAPTVGDPGHLSPVTHQHINFYGRYDFTNRHPPQQGLRLLRNT